MRLDSLNLGMLNLGDVPDAVGEEQRGLSGLCWVTQSRSWKPCLPVSHPYPTAALSPTRNLYLQGAIARSRGLTRPPGGPL